MLTSLNGHHVQCFYYIDICVTLQNHQEGSLTVPIYCLIHSKNTEFLQWKPPSWIYESEVIMGKSIFSVSETALRSEAFSDIPRFQALESDDWYESTDHYFFLTSNLLTFCNFTNCLTICVQFADVAFNDIVQNLIFIECYCLYLKTYTISSSLFRNVVYTCFTFLNEFL